MKAAKPADRKRMLIHLTLGADEKELVVGEEGEEGEEGDDGEEDNEGGVSRASESEAEGSRGRRKTLDGVLKTARTTAKRASKRAMRIRACDTAVCTCSCGKHMFRASHEIRYPSRSCTRRADAQPSGYRT